MYFIAVHVLYDKMIMIIIIILPSLQTRYERKTT